MVVFSRASHFKDSYVVNSDSEDSERTSDSEDSGRTSDDESYTADGADDKLYQKQMNRKETVLKSIANKGRAKKFFQQQHLTPHLVKAKCMCKSKLVKGDTVSGNFFFQKTARCPRVTTTAT